MGEVGKGNHVALLGALLDGTTDDALRLYDGIIAQAKLKGEEDHWLRRLGPLFEPAAPRIAINVYQRLLQVSPGDLFAQRRLAAVLTRAGDYDAADAAYHTLLARKDFADQVQAEALEGLAAIAAARRGPAGQAKKPKPRPSGPVGGDDR